MVGESRIPPGVSLLLIGSGLYWILSSQLISSFTVLTPGLFQDNALGGSLITVVGTISAAMGLSIVRVDLDEFRGLVARRDGWTFTIPLALASSDAFLTLVVLSTNSQIVELNPFVSSAIAIGSIAVVPFILSYLALSQGLGLFMLRVAAYGPVSNLVLSLDPSAGMSAYFLGAIGCCAVSIFLFTHIDARRSSVGKAKFQ